MISNTRLREQTMPIVACSPPQPGKASVECLVHRVPEIVELVLCLGLTLDEAEEAAQETMIAGWEAIESGRANSIRDRTAWLRHVGLLKAFTILRQRPRYVLTDGLDRLPAAGVIERRGDNATCHSELYDALRRLPHDLRRPVELYYLNGLSERAAAITLGVSQNTVRRRIAEALVELGKLL